MPQKGILSGIEPGLIVDVRKLRIYKDFHAQTSLGFTQYDRKKKRKSSEWQFFGWKSIVNEI